mmetsp:Transcript_15964/g.24162  ORF Transcript_15964/g.24162 Transcript_15964/m.24162 type:complete len:943 (+) Transcript_15964:108-2936(+)
MAIKQEKQGYDTDADDDSDIAFATINFDGVNFDEDEVDDNSNNYSDRVCQMEHVILFDFDSIPEILNVHQQEEDFSIPTRTMKWIRWLHDGNYVALLRDAEVTPKDIFKMLQQPTRDELLNCFSVRKNNKNHDEYYLEMVLIGIASLNLYLQLNYTGPSLEQASKRSHEHDTNYDSFEDILLPISNDSKEGKDKNRDFHNGVLSELVVDGDWPCQVCLVPYWLWVSRTVFSLITSKDKNYPSQVWSMRAAVSHARLLLNSSSTPPSLSTEIRTGFRSILIHYCQDLDPWQSASPDGLDQGHKNEKFSIAASLLVEWGLAQHHLDRPGKGRLSFLMAKQYSGLVVELSGSLGKRTKYQQNAIAQLKIEARNIRRELGIGEKGKENNSLPSQDIVVEHPEDGILLEKIKYEDGEENLESLLVLDQCILMALCLDVKNTNPDKDVLTAEEMGAYLARVLWNLDDEKKSSSNSDWMIYATALLERAWLEYQSSHGRERALLQLQALLDQHTNKLTITQSTYDSVQLDSSPARDRLRNLHQIVYPPRWHMIADVAERYATLGIVTSAAELFQQIELWDEVVECYRRAGKETMAKQIVEDQLSIPSKETPRMWAALGDLTKDPKYYHKALDLSHGRFSSAWVALGQHAFDQGNLQDATDYYRRALELRPLSPGVWFRLGIIGMQMKEWSLALEAFSQVVQQEPTEGEAWANVAAIHMHRKEPNQAYPALIESLKQNRNNWRVWYSKLYTCLDLKKYDEAIQACHVLMDLRFSRSSDVPPPLEEHCVRAIVGGSVSSFSTHNEKENDNEESMRRTMTRVMELLHRLSTQPPVEPWVFECQAIIATQLSQHEEVILEQMLREYRALQAVPGRWEKDHIQKLVNVVSQISKFYLSPSSESNFQERLVKCRLLVRGLISKLEKLDYYAEVDQIHELQKILTQVKQTQETLTA